MTLQGHFGLSQRVKAHISSVAAFKGLINVKLNADHSGQSAVAGVRVTGVKISKTLQDGIYSTQKDITQQTVPIYYIHCYLKQTEQQTGS